MPGVIHLHATIGDDIKPGQRIAVIEAMKMEAPIICTSAGILASFAVPAGTQAEPGDLIATITLT